MRFQRPTQHFDNFIVRSRYILVTAIVPPPYLNTAHWFYPTQYSPTYDNRRPLYRSCPVRGRRLRMSDDASDLRRGRETCRSLTPGPRPGRRRRMRLNRRRTLRRRPAGDPTALTTADVVRGPWTRRLGRRSLEVCRTGPSMDARPAASYARRDRPIAYRFVPIGRRPVALRALNAPAPSTRA